MPDDENNGWAPQHVDVRRGDDVNRRKTTVNDPCHAFGYKVHQAAWFNDIARLRITNTDGRVILDTVLDFNNETTAVPALLVTNVAGEKLFEGMLPQMGTDPGETVGREDDYATARLVFPEVGADPGRDRTGLAVVRMKDVARPAGPDPGR